MQSITFRELTWKEWKELRRQIQGLLKDRLPSLIQQALNNPQWQLLLPELLGEAVAGLEQLDELMQRFASGPLEDCLAVEVLLLRKQFMEQTLGKLLEAEKNSLRHLIDGAGLVEITSASAAGTSPSSTTSPTTTDGLQLS